MPGRPIPPPTATVAIGLDHRVAHWDADYVVQRRLGDGSWQTINVVERDGIADTTLVRRRAAMRALRDRVMAGEPMIDHDRREALNWDGTRLGRR